jgi:hypothetical protein
VRQKIIASAIALTLGSFAAVGAFASQDAIDLRGATGLLSGGVLGAEVAADPSATAEPTSTETPDATETATVSRGDRTPDKHPLRRLMRPRRLTPRTTNNDDADEEHGDVHSIRHRTRATTGTAATQFAEGRNRGQDHAERHASQRHVRGPASSQRRPRFQHDTPESGGTGRWRDRKTNPRQPKPCPEEALSAEASPHPGDQLAHAALRVSPVSHRPPPDNP